MLPELNLDQEQFKDMAEEMCNQISSICPAWTDYNAHDPGITLIELFAWLQEIQQYHMNQPGNGQLRQYLKLLGERCRSRRAAKNLLELSSGSPLTVKKGSRFQVGDFWFETERECRLPGMKILCCGIWEEGQWTVVDDTQLSSNGKMELYPFGKKLSGGTCFYMGFSEPMKPGQPEWLSVLIKDEETCKRNLIVEKDFSLSKLEYEYYGKDGWRPLTVLQDEGFGFLQTGFLQMACDTEMESFSLEGRQVYGVRIWLKESGYETAPVITGLSFCHVPALQKKTAARAVNGLVEWEDETGGLLCITAADILEENEEAECWLQFGNHLKKAEPREVLKNGKLQFSILSEAMPEAARILIFDRDFALKRLLPEGDGFPFQKAELENPHLLAEDFELMVQDPEEASFMKIWRRVEDFHVSGPEDCHYVLDEHTGTLSFGDGFRGMAPEGKMLISGYASSFGAAGNINEAVFESPAYPKIRAVSCLNGFGGRNPEHFEEAFYRVGEAVKLPGQALTLEDYEKLALKTPGLKIQACRAYMSGDSQITVAVMPYCEEGAGILSRRGAMAVRRYLEEFRMIGTGLRVKSPEYIQISMTIQLYINPRYHNGRQAAEDAVRRYFDELGSQMGQPLLYRSIRMLLERLDCVEKTGYLVLDAKGGGFKRNSSKDVLVPPDGVCLLKNLECLVLEL